MKERQQSNIEAWQEYFLFREWYLSYLQVIDKYRQAYIEALVEQHQRNKQSVNMIDSAIKLIDEMRRLRSKR